MKLNRRGQSESYCRSKTSGETHLQLPETIMPLGVNPFRPEMRRTPERVSLGPDISELPPFWTAYAGPINSGNASPVCALLYLTLLNGGRWISTRFLQKSRLASKHCWAGQKRATPEVLRLPLATP